MATEIIYINFTGGIVSPGFLKDVLEIAAMLKVSQVTFGLRQQLIIELPVKQLPAFRLACADKGIVYASKKEGRPNIVSSYPAAGIFTPESWVREGVYKDIFNSFDFTPQVKININDSNQSFVPFFTGHVNWISSEAAHFWYLYVRFPKTDQVHLFPECVYTNDIAAVSKQLELLLASKEITDSETLYKKLKANLAFISKPAETELVLPKFSLPYYEGFNKHENNYWLGIYRREEAFPVAFLLQLCSICIETKIGQLYTTTWKSIIIKGIEANNRNDWDDALGRYRINVRHAANELNWQVEDHCENGLQIKRQIIRYFDKQDVRTYGLSFVVKTHPFSSMFGSVVIRQQAVKNPDRLKALERFEILHTADFNPNASTLVLYRQDIEKEYLGTYLVSLCKYFYERESRKQERPSTPNGTPNTAITSGSEKVAYQCKNCLTVYDDTFGDEENGIAPGTAFIDLPETYRCPLCESPRQEFLGVNANSMELSE
jgi:rubredoxin